MVAKPNRGLDIGTAFIVAADNVVDEGASKVRWHSVRDCFMSLPTEQAFQLDIAGVNYDEGTNSLFIIGNDAIKMAAATGNVCQRPLARGFINADEAQGKEVAMIIMRKILGEPRTPGEVVVFSIPGAGVGQLGQVPQHFHTRFFKDAITSLGYRAVPFNEAAAIIFAETRNDKKLPLTGLAISFGAGCTNVALVYKSLVVKSFNIQLGGDWIDQSAAKATNADVSAITLLKEHGVDVTTGAIINRNESHDDKSDIYADAIKTMYADLLSRLTTACNDFFNAHENRVEISETLPVYISGGTTKVPGFEKLFAETFMQGFKPRFSLYANAIPAKNPLTCVAEGCLAAADIMTAKKTNS